MINKLGAVIILTPYVLPEQLNYYFDINSFLLQHIRHSWFRCGSLRCLVWSNLYQSSTLCEAGDEQRSISCLRALWSRDLGLG